ncbi:MAG: glycerol kinase [Gammaproteobacteria bacterium]|nr:glycerol kinase [Gammaproteobacteria bacterium]
MSAVLALDQGTSSSRAIVFDASGKILGVGSQPLASHYPAPGQVEQDPGAIWQGTLQSARDAIDKAGVKASDLLGIGIANQRETCIFWHRQTGEALGPAIVWQDRRTAEMCEQMRRDGLTQTVSEATGLVLDPYFSSTKIAWRLNQDAHLKALAEKGELCCGTVDAFLIARLTGKHATDATNASRTQLFDINRQVWHQDLLGYHDIPASILPDVLDCADDYGTTPRALLGAPLPVLGVAGDQQAALIGQGCFSVGATKATYGTGCFVMSNTGRARLASGNQLLSTIGYRVGGETTYALEASLFVAGMAIKWLRDNIGLIDSAKDTEACARETGGDTGGVLFVPALSGLGAPHWQPNARGLIRGLSLDTTRAQLVTAVLASIGYSTAELLDVMGQDGATTEALQVDGGMVVNSWLCQWIADLCQVPVERPKVAESTALGAAMLTLLGVGEYSSLDECPAMRQVDQVFAPRPMPVDAHMREWRNAVQTVIADGLAAHANT